MSNHLMKKKFVYFLLDNSPSRMVEVKEVMTCDCSLSSSFPYPVIIWQIIWLANTLCHKKSQDSWCIVLLCAILNQAKSEQFPLKKKTVSPDGFWCITTVKLTCYKMLGSSWVASPARKFQIIAKQVGPLDEIASLCCFPLCIIY